MFCSRNRPAHTFLNSMPVSSNKPSYRHVRPIQPAAGPKAKGSEGPGLSREQVDLRGGKEIPNMRETCPTPCPTSRCPLMPRPPCRRGL